VLPSKRGINEMSMVW